MADPYIKRLEEMGREAAGNSRLEFEAAHDAVYTGMKLATWREGKHYKDAVVQARWEGWKLCRRSQSDAAGK